MKKRLYIFFLIFLSSFLILNAQIKRKSKKTIRGEAGIVKAVENKAFRQTFTGIYNFAVSFNVGFNKFNAGVFYGMTQFEISPLGYYGISHSIQLTYAGGLKFTYDFPSASGKGMFSPFIAPGYSFVNYSRLSYVTTPPTQTSAMGVSVNAGLTYTIMLDDWLGVGMNVGYTVFNHTFNPDPLAISQTYPNFTASDKQGIIQNFLLGFTFYFDFARPRDTEDE